MGIFDKIIKKKKTEDKVKPVKADKKDIAKETEVKAKTDKYSTLKSKAEVATSVEVKAEAGKEVVGQKLSKVDPVLAYKVLIKPLITEKATTLVGLNKYAFNVAKSANKAQVKRAIKALYGFDPVSVNIINGRGKRVTYGRIKGKKSNWKKAIITLKQGDKLEIYEGV